MSINTHQATYQKIDGLCNKFETITKSEIISKERSTISMVEHLCFLCCFDLYNSPSLEHTKRTFDEPEYDKHLNVFSRKLM